MSAAGSDSDLAFLPPEQRALVQAILNGVDVRLQSEVASLRAEIRVLQGRLLDKLYSKKEVAMLSGVSVRTVERRIAEGRLRPVPGKHPLRFTPEEVDRAQRAGVL